VQVYYHDKTSNISAVSKRLARFEKVFLKAGQSVSVLLAFEANTFAEWDRLVRKRTVVPGDFDILVGGSSEDIKLRGKVWVR
jgi:beta-glucosidase